MSWIRLFWSVDPPPRPTARELWRRLPWAVLVTGGVGLVWHHWVPLAVMLGLLATLWIQPRLAMYFVWLILLTIIHLVRKLSWIPLIGVYLFMITPLGVGRRLLKRESESWRVPSSPIAKDDFLRPY